MPAPEPAPASAPFSALLLAGGRSSRMGRDKALLPHPVSGLPLLAHQAALLRSLPGCAELLLSAPADRGYALTGPLADARLVPDAAPDCGPLAGLAAGLAVATQPRLLVLAVDLPFVTPAFLRELLSTTSAFAGAVPCHFNSTPGFEPLCAVYPRTRAKGHIDSAFAAKEFSLQRILNAAVREGWMQPLRIHPESEPIFANWNTPADAGLP